MFRVPSAWLVRRGEQAQPQGEQPGPRAGHETRSRHVQSHRIYKTVQEEDIPPPETKYLKRRKISFTGLDS